MNSSTHTYLFFPIFVCITLQLVYRSKALALLEQASSWSPAAPRGSPAVGDQNKLCEDMMVCLEKIADVEFVVDVCSKAAMPAFEDTARILQYARTRVSKPQCIIRRLGFMKL